MKLRCDVSFVHGVSLIRISFLGQLLKRLRTEESPSLGLDLHDSLRPRPGTIHSSSDANGRCILDSPVFCLVISDLLRLDWPHSPFCIGLWHSYNIAGFEH